MIGATDKLRALIEKTVKGEADAFSEIAAMYSPLTESIISHYCPREYTAEDIKDIRQELVISLYNAVLAYDLSREKIEFGLFAKICMTNKIISRLRQYERRKEREIPSSDEDIIYSENEKSDFAEPSLLLIDKENVDTINELVDKNLSEFEKSVFKLYISGYSSGEMANILGTNNKSVENSIYRIRKKLKALLK